MVACGGEASCCCCTDWAAAGAPLPPPLAAAAPAAGTGAFERAGKSSEVTVLTYKRLSARALVLDGLGGGRPRRAAPLLPFSCLRLGCGGGDRMYPANLGLSRQCSPQLGQNPVSFGSKVCD